MKKNNVINKQQNIEHIISQNEELQNRLAEAEDTLRAIRHGEIDALVVKGNDGNRVYTLKGAEYTYRILIESMNEGAVTFDKKGTIVYSNKSFAKMVGLPLEKVIGFPISSFIPVKELDIFETFVNKSQHRHNTKRESNLNTVKGESIPVLFSITPFQLEDDQIGLSMIISDLTEQKANEEIIASEKLAQVNLIHEQEARKQAEESEEKFRTMADNIPNLAWMANSDGWIFWYNSRWYEYTGTTPKEMEGWGWQSVHDPKVLPDVLKRWKSSIAKGEPFEMIFPLKGADGVFRPFLTRITPVKDKNGRIVRWFGSNTDITKQVELERQKDEFIGIASHELKTPVTSIKAYTQVLKYKFQKSGDPASAKQLSKMDVQLNKLTSLIGDLLDVTKIEAGKLHFNEVYFSFDEIVKDVIEQMQFTSEKHTLIINCTTKKKIYGDKERISQVITNLLSNAIKYSPHSSKIIVKGSTEKGNVKLCVQDFGIGMSKSAQEKVFERFYRVSGPNNLTFPGLGLGLYISSEIIKRLGGKIWVESVKGKGSTFCFTLPTQKRKLKLK